MTQSAQTVSQTTGKTTSSSVSARFLAAVQGSKNGLNASGFADVLDQAVASSVDQARAFADETSSRQSDQTENDTTETASTSLSSGTDRAVATARSSSDQDAQKTSDVSDRKAKETARDDTASQQADAGKTPLENRAASTKETKEEETDLVSSAGPAETLQAPSQTSSDLTKAKEAEATTSGDLSLQVKATQGQDDQSLASGQKTGQTASQAAVPAQDGKTQTSETSDEATSQSDDSAATDAASALLSQMIAMRQAQQNRDAMKDAADKEADQTSVEGLDDAQAASSDVVSFADFAQARQEALHKDPTQAQNADKTKGPETSTTDTSQTTTTGTASSDTQTSRAAFSSSAGKHGIASLQTASSVSANAANAAAQAATASAGMVSAAPISSSGTGAASEAASGAASASSTYDLSGVASGSGATNGSSGAAMGDLVALKDEQASTGNQTSVIEQVKVQLQKMAKTGKDQMTISLTPDDMGKIEIKLKFGDDKSVQGTVIADNKTTLDALQKDQAGLQQALKDAGLQADSNSLQFSLRGDGGSFAQNNYGQSSGQSRGEQTKSWRLGVVASEGEAETETQSNYSLASGRINLRV